MLGAWRKDPVFIYSYQPLRLPTEYRPGNPSRKFPTLEKIRKPLISLVIQAGRVESGQAASRWQAQRQVFCAHIAHKVIHSTTVYWPKKRCQALLAASSKAFGRIAQRQ